MATPSPFLFLEGILRNLPFPNLQIPPWAVDELQRRVVLLLNHVLSQESEACARLARQEGRIILVQWQRLTLKLLVTPAGLLDRAPVEAAADLTLTLADESALDLAQAALGGDKPPVRIEGDVQLAAEVNWLVEHVRWDLEEDLSRLLGDAPAHALGQVAGAMAQALRQLLAGASGRAKAPT